MMPGWAHRTRAGASSGVAHRMNAQRGGAVPPNLFSALFSDTGQELEISDANQTGLDITGDLSVQAWVKKDDDAASHLCILGKAELSSQISYYLNYDNVGGERWYFVLSGNGSTLSTHSSVSRSIGAVWCHISVVYDAAAQTVTFYENGSIIGTPLSSTVAAIHDSPSPFRIGRRTAAYPQHYFTGGIDEVRVWSRTLSADEIAANYSTRIVAPQAGLVGCWALEEDLTDCSGNGNELSGGASFVSDVPFM